MFEFNEEMLPETEYAGEQEVTPSLHQGMNGEGLNILPSVSEGFMYDR
jgi:hypothetical protein